MAILKVLIVLALVAPSFRWWMYPLDILGYSETASRFGLTLPLYLTSRFGECYHALRKGDITLQEELL